MYKVFMLIMTVEMVPANIILDACSGVAAPQII